MATVEPPFSRQQSKENEGETKNITFDFYIKLFVNFFFFIVPTKCCPWMNIILLILFDDNSKKFHSSIPDSTTLI